MEATTRHTIFHISDSALTIDFGNIVNEDLNRIILALFNRLQREPLAGMIEAVPAYSSLTIYYDLVKVKKRIPVGNTIAESMESILDGLVREASIIPEPPPRTITIPVCYEAPYSADLDAIASKHQLSLQEVIERHLNRTYRVHMLGFLPGFAYMGEIDSNISMPRKTQPAPVVAGSVGIAGLQTGIYPMSSPGGWYIIGRTPLSLFDSKKEELTLFRAGDYVNFTAITKHEFENY